MVTQEDSLDLESLRRHALSMPSELSQSLPHASISSSLNTPSHLPRAQVYAHDHDQANWSHNLAHGNAIQMSSDSIISRAPSNSINGQQKSDSLQSSMGHRTSSTNGTGDTIPISQTVIQNFLRRSKAACQPYPEEGTSRPVCMEAISQYSDSGPGSSGASQQLRLFSTLRDATQSDRRASRQEDSDVAPGVDETTEASIHLLEQDTPNETDAAFKSSPTQHGSMMNPRRSHYNGAPQPSASGRSHYLQTPNPSAASENPFAGKLNLAAPVLPLSQVFNGSSPGSGFLRSEISELPSPNIPISLNPALGLEELSSPVPKRSPYTNSFPSARKWQPQHLPSKLSRNACNSSDYEREDAGTDYPNYASDDDDDEGIFPQNGHLHQGRVGSLKRSSNVPSPNRADARPGPSDSIFPFATFPAPTRGKENARNCRSHLHSTGESEEETEPDETASQRRVRSQARIRVVSDQEEDKENIRDERIALTGSAIRTRSVFSQPLEVNDSPSFRARSYVHFASSAGVSQSQPVMRNVGNQQNGASSTHRGRNGFISNGGSRFNSPEADRAQVPCSSQSEDETEQEDQTRTGLTRPRTVDTRRSGQSLRSRQLSPEENGFEEDKENRYHRDMPSSQSHATVRAHEALSQILQTGSSDHGESAAVEEHGRPDKGDGYVMKIHEDAEDATVLQQTSTTITAQPQHVDEESRGDTHSVGLQDDQAGSQSSRKPLSQIGGSNDDGPIAQSTVVPPSDTEDEVDSDDEYSALARSRSPTMDRVARNIFPASGRSQVANMDGTNNGPNEGPTNDENTAPSAPRIYQTPAVRPPSRNDHSIRVPETSPAKLRGFMADSSSRAETPLAHQKIGETRLESDGVDIFSKRDEDGRLRVLSNDETQRSKTELPNAILSPSGRRRKRLTEIAAEGSQSQGQPLPDLSSLGVFTADDLEFQSLMHRRSPVKSRSGHQGAGGSSVFSGAGVNLNSRTGGDENLRNETGYWPMPGLQSTPTPPESPPDVFTAEGQAQKRGRESADEVAGSDNQDDNHEPPRKRQRATTGLHRSLSDASASSPLLPKHIPASSMSKLEAKEYTPSTPKHSSPSQTQPRASRSESPDPLAADTTITTPLLSQTVGNTVNQFTHPHQVFAFFNGRPQGFYPATCVGTTQKYGRRRFLVLFEGSTKADEVGEDGLKRLELRPGDSVKLDLLDMPKVGWTVLGCPRRAVGKEQLGVTTESASTGCVTDVFGHESVVIEHKSSTTSQTSTVPIKHVWFDRHLWNKLADRKYVHTEYPSAGSLRFQTPTGSNSTPTVSASRTSRASHATSMPAGGLFSNMAFAVSIKDGGTNRFQIEKLIRANGGRILQEGFDELFHIARNDEDEKDTCLRLLSDFENLGFVSLITDEHSRRVKYMQALALNLPCLAYRWVKDCVDKDCLLDWDPYLLPAGESKFLDGAVRSRMLAPYSPSSAHLSQIVKQRYKLLAGQSVIFVAAKGKAAEARRAYAFLLYAMGARAVFQVQDVNAAVRTLKQGDHDCPWDWIYVGDESSAPAACNVLREEFGASAGLPRDITGGSKSTAQKQPKKRGRKSGSGVGVANLSSVMIEEPITINGKKLRVLVNDFICQSLILGRLYPGYG